MSGVSAMSGISRSTRNDRPSMTRPLSEMRLTAHRCRPSGVKRTPCASNPRADSVRSSRLFLALKTYHSPSESLSGWTRPLQFAITRVPCWFTATPQLAFTTSGS
jgi:hypothetical protein